MHNIYSKIPILVYHHFVETETENMSYCTTIEKFEKDILLLKNNGFIPISLQKVCSDNYVYDSKHVVIVFEDGYTSVYSMAFAILKKYNIHADVFVPTSLMGISKHPQYNNFIPHFGKNEAIEMINSELVTLHPHGHIHSWDVNWSDSEVVDNYDISNDIISSIAANDHRCFLWHDTYITDKNIELLRQKSTLNLVSIDFLTDNLIDKGFCGYRCVNYTSSILNLINDFRERLFQNTSVFCLYENADSAILHYDGFDTKLMNNEVKVFTHNRIQNEQYDLSVFVGENDVIHGYGFSNDTSSLNEGITISARGWPVNALLHAVNSYKKVSVTRNELIFYEGKNSPEINSDNMYFSRRAVWYRPIERSEEQVVETIKKISRMNFNIIYLESWFDGKFIGFSENDVICHHEELFGEFDVLESFCRIGKLFNIQIHIWVENFFIGALDYNLKATNLLQKRFNNDLLLDCNGRNYNETLDGNFVFLNPYSYNCQELLLNLYEEVVTKYSPDGIHLDYIRFPADTSGNDFGYNQNIIDDFIKFIGYKVNILDMSLDEENVWKRFREDIINKYVCAVHTRLKSINPNIWISCAVFPDIHYAKNELFQNACLWAEHQWVDEIISMTYTIDHTYVQKNIDNWKKALNNNVLYTVGISLMGKLPGFELFKQFQITFEKAIDSYAVFSWPFISFDDYEDLLKRINRRR